MIVAQISDTHIAADAADAVRRIEDFALTIADINALDPAADVIVHTGDLVHNGRPEEYAQAVSIMAAARAPVYVLAGNKDNRTNLRAAVKAGGYLPADSRFIAYGIEDYPIRLLALDTLSDRSNKGDFCAERIDGLLGMVEADAKRPIAVFAHHPPFAVPVGPDPLNFETPQALERLRRALLRSGRVIAVFCGHVHRGTAGYVGTIPVTVMPAVATSLRKDEFPPGMKNRPVYYLHRYDPAWGFVTEARLVGTGTDRHLPQGDGENSSRGRLLVGARPPH